jgi:hypothetical protein
VSDLFSFDLADGFVSGRCPICYALAVDERRWLDSFWREGRRDPDTRRRFYSTGGFCASHAWLLHQLAVDADAGSAVADVYGGLAAHDLSELDGLISGGIPRRRKGGGSVLHRVGECSACVAGAEALERKVHFFLVLLGREVGRERYERSAGLCLVHLRAAIAVDECGGETGLFLVRDWRRRVAAASERLAEFDPTRKPQHAGSGEDVRRPWTDLIRLYVGDPPARAPRA